jgi:hypothetical protein
MEIWKHKMSLYRKIGWFLNKKRGRNDLFMISALLIDGMLQPFFLFKPIKGHLM